jgi:glycine cleavage system H protein
MTVYFTTEHEWIRVDGDVGTVGITAFASDKLGDVVFIDLPKIGQKVTQSGDMAVVESVKAASDVYAPVDGEVVAINDALTGAPETVNAEPEGAGWFCRLKLSRPDQLSELMDKAAYDAFCASQ